MRRANSLADMHELAVASAVATSLGQDVPPPRRWLARVTYLRRSEIVPMTHGLPWPMAKWWTRCAGRRGTFLPIPDVQMKTATQSELSAYLEFVQRYQQQWGRVDPLAVTLDSQQDAKEPREQVHHADLDHARCAAAICFLRGPSWGSHN